MPAKKVQIPLRIPETLRARVESAAKRNGTSMNAEVRHRLELSFARQDRLGGPDLAQLVETIAIVMKSAGEHAGFVATGKVAKHGAWLVVPYAYDQALQSALAILEARRPPGEIVVPKPNVVAGETKADTKESIALVQNMYANLGRLMAAYELEREEDDEQREHHAPREEVVARQVRRRPRQ